MQSTSKPVPRAQRTRNALISAGFDLVARKPIDAIAIDEFVAVAGVAKGSFFNHFEDKQAFAAALAAEVRLELESDVRRANDGIANPLERIARGLVVCARFAHANHKRTAVLLRSSSGVADRTHPLNEGISRDFDEAAREGMIGNEARDSGVLFWLGLCQALMAYLAENERALPDMGARTGEMLYLGLSGLGLDPSRAAAMTHEALGIIGPHPLPQSIEPNAHAPSSDETDDG